MKEYTVHVQPTIEQGQVVELDPALWLTVEAEHHAQAIELACEERGVLPTHAFIQSYKTKSGYIAADCYKLIKEV